MTLHCWQDYRDTLEFASEAWAESYVNGNATCMLEHGHEGPHEWTPDENIGVSFASSPTSSEEKEG